MLTSLSVRFCFVHLQVLHFDFLFLWMFASVAVVIHTTASYCANVGLICVCVWRMVHWVAWFGGATKILSVLHIEKQRLTEYLLQIEKCVESCCRTVCGLKARRKSSTRGRCLERVTTSDQSQGRKNKIKPVSLSLPGPEQALVPAGRYPNSRRLPGKAAVWKPALRPAAQPALPPSLAGQCTAIALLCQRHMPSVLVTVATLPVVD